jgi:hypothetical protein
MEYNPELITIFESPDDGSCFFYSVAYQLLTELGCHGNDKLDTIKNYVKNWDKVLVKNEIIEDEIVEFSKKLQSYIYNYIVENQYDIIDIGFETTIENGIFIIHGITWEEYTERYKYFAGKEYEYVDSKKKLDDRWGSTLEQVVLAKLLGINIVVYTPQVYYPSLKQFKSSIYKNGKFQKNTVLNKISNFNYGEFTINLLWKKFYGKGHYMGFKTVQPTILAFKL